MRRRLIACCLLATSLVAMPHATGAAASPPAAFTVTAIPAPDGTTFSSANAINAKGSAVGYAAFPNPDTGQTVVHPMLYQGEKTRLMGGEGITGSALNISNRGHVVGLVFPPDDLTISHPALFTSRTYTDLGALGEGGSGIANSINAKDQIVGGSALSSDQGAITHAYLWEDGEMTDLGALAEGAASSAADINDKGLIVGQSGTAAGGQTFQPGAHATLWKNGKPRDLGTLPGGDQSIAVAINEHGQIIGASTTGAGQTYGNAGTQGFLWEDGTMQALPLPNGSVACLAAGINQNGWITGICATPGSDTAVGTSFAVLWIDGEIYDLTAMVAVGGWTVQRAGGINDAGQIACGGTSADGVSQGLILTPVVA